jgi:toxin ParE1/3/4
VNIAWSKRAIRNLIALRDFIARDSPDAAAIVASRILDSVELLATQPQMGRSGRIFGTRELVIPSAPYIIAYRIRDQRLELLAVFHGRQKWPVKV